MLITFRLPILRAIKSPTPKDVIKNWMRTHDVIEYLGLWETLYNPSFKGVEFDSFKARSGSNLNRAAREQLSLLLRSSAATGWRAES